MCFFSEDTYPVYLPLAWVRGSSQASSFFWFLKGTAWSKDIFHAVSWATYITQEKWRAVSFIPQIMALTVSPP